MSIMEVIDRVGERVEEIGVMVSVLCHCQVCIPSGLEGVLNGVVRM